VAGVRDALEDAVRCEAHIVEGYLAPGEPEDADEADVRGEGWRG
jgi:hypothetical protein